MFPNSINPVSLLGDVFLSRLHNRFSSFPNIFGQLYRSILGNAVDQSGYPVFYSDRNASPVYLGDVSPETPTVYSLLKAHPDYGKSPSAVLDAPVNRGKTFKCIPTGSCVYLNPNTSELSWSMTPPPNDFSPNARYPLKPTPLSHRLDRVVKSYVGTSYEEIDCYELLVKGITDMGFRYHGAGGIKDRLIQRAETSGKKSNAYLTGEGLVQATGNIVYSRSLNPSGNHRLQAAKIYEEMTRRLSKGHILSFSTRTRGHTGIVSRRDGQWTFINSGDMDHNLSGKHRSMEVGEEDLKAEIENWLRRAAGRKEKLQISVGRLDGRKLAGYINPGSLIERRV